MSVNIRVCFLQIVTVKSPVGQEMFPKTVLRKSWNPGVESSIDGKASKVTERMRCADIKTDIWIK